GEKRNIAAPAIISHAVSRAPQVQRAAYRLAGRSRWFCCGCFVCLSYCLGVDYRTVEWGAGKGHVPSREHVPDCSRRNVDETGAGGAWPEGLQSPYCTLRERRSEPFFLSQARGKNQRAR